jgi:hypothetical protein
VAALVSGASVRQLYYWQRRGYLVPEGWGEPEGAWWSAADVARARVLAATSRLSGRMLGAVADELAGGINGAGRWVRVAVTEGDVDLVVEVWPSDEAVA